MCFGGGSTPSYTQPTPTIAAAPAIMASSQVASAGNSAAQKAMLAASQNNTIAAGSAQGLANGSQNTAGLTLLGGTK